MSRMGKDRAPAGSPARRKLVALSALPALRARLSRRGIRVVFTNGCFDLLHPGHVDLLEKARRLGDALVVGLNSDRSVRALKGAGRPLMRERDRARVLAALSCVDYVTIFGEPTPLRAIRLLGPDVLVKGADWGAGQIVGREEVEAIGGKVVRIPLKRGFSTTRLIERIRIGGWAASRGKRRPVRKR